MKTSHASILSVISLSLALCACDSGDKKTSEAAPLPPKKPKAEAADAKGNLQPPDSTDAAKPMSPGAPAEGGTGASDPQVPTDQAVGMLNGLVSMYNQKVAGGGQMAMQGMDMRDPKAAQKKFQENQKKADAKKLKSLDELVTAGLIKKLPDAPPGKKFVFDAKTQTVIVANQ